ncbi:hypothetical protein BDY19DRAFT_954928, partial [Irpex rosettiformis]
MSTNKHSHSPPPRDRKGPSTCFLPNCAFIVQPLCPSCECKQKESVSIDVTSSTLFKTDSGPLDSNAKVTTRVAVLGPDHAVTEEFVGQAPPKIISLKTGEEKGPPVIKPNPSMFELDSGTVWLQCDECGSVFQVYFNATISVVASGLTPVGAN